MRSRNHRRHLKQASAFVRIEGLPDREAILAALAARARPCALRELAADLQVKQRAAAEALARRVDAMARDGQVVRTRSGRYGIAEQMELVQGQVLSHRDGFAFVRNQNGADIFLPPREARGTLHGDRVLVRVAGHDQRGRPYGRVVEVLERAHATVVGRYYEEDGFGYVVPDNRHLNQDVLIPSGKALNEIRGQVDVARIERHPDRHLPPQGQVTEVLGDHLSPGMEVEMAARSYHLPLNWSEETEHEIAGFPEEVRSTDFAARVDLTAIPLATIDGEDARDFDDALFARRNARGFTLVVAIADVAHYVSADSAVDKDARSRGTSVYFPNRVVPMLPEKLSNHLCSLVPGEDRLAVVCEMNIGLDGGVRRTRFFEAVIRSHARLTYDAVHHWREGRGRTRLDVPEGVVESLGVLYDIFGLLIEQRISRCALDLDSAEARFKLSATGKIEGIESRVRTDAHRLVEECMVAANVAAARFLLKQKQAAIFRVHEDPADEKLEDLKHVARSVALPLPKGELTAANLLAGILRAAKGRPDQRLLQTLVLRSLKLAVYRAENTGHFGLALPAYTHFTSPIRRYPDLTVHRALKQILARAPGTLPKDTSALAEHCSMTERRAEEATRDVEQWLKCEFMLDKVGQCYSGTVSSVVEFGLFVELDELLVEGLVHISSLPGDYYHFDPERHTLGGRSRQHSFGLGQAVSVRVEKVDLDLRRIDFALENARRGGRKARSGGAA